MTPVDQRVLLFIQRSLRERGIAPTHTEIREGLELKMSDHVAKSLDRLVRDGYVEKDADVARGIRILRALPLEEKSITLTTRKGLVAGRFFVITPAS